MVAAVITTTDAKSVLNPSIQDTTFDTAVGTILCWTNRLNRVCSCCTANFRSQPMLVGCIAVPSNFLLVQSAVRPIESCVWKLVQPLVQHSCYAANSNALLPCDHVKAFSIKKL